MTTTSAAAARPAGPVWFRSTETGLSFRPMDAADLPFLRQVYAATRADELALVDWPEAQKAAFVAQQFDAQHTHYQRHYPGADWLVVLHRDEPVGRLYLDRRASDFGLIDIALLPEHRRRGLGTALLKDLLDEAASAGKAVAIHVEKFNPARRLYARLGFVLVEDKGIYDLMLWHPTDLAKEAHAWSGQPKVAS